MGKAKIMNVVWILGSLKKFKLFFMILYKFCDRRLEYIL